MSDQLTTSELIRRAQAGDSDAVSVLYQTYVERIYRYVYYRVNNESDAEDITAEVFVTMVKALPTYEDRGIPFEAWLYRIASARVIDMRRKDTRHPQQELDERMSDIEDSPEQIMVDEAEREEIRQALSQLSESDQEILILRFIERKSHQDVAKILEKSLTAVKSAQHRALVRLANELGESKVRHYFRGDSDD